MPVSTKTEKDHVDPWDLRFGAIREPAERRLIFLCAGRGVGPFPRHPIDMVGVNSQRVKQRRLGRVKIAFGMSRRHTAFIAKEEKYLGPIESRFPSR